MVIIITIMIIIIIMPIIIIIIITIIIITALYRQSSPYWKVFFYPLDRLSFSSRLREVVDNLKDNKRFSFVEVFDRPPNFRLKVSLENDDDDDVDVNEEKK